MRCASLLTDIPDHLPKELAQVLTSGTHARIERIVSRGHISAPDFWYDQDWDEFVLLVAGAGRLEFELEQIEMKPGDYVHIPAHRRHRVAWTHPEQPTVWLAVHYEV